MSVHSTHCCKTHVCNSDEDCPVVLGKEEQEFPCEDCDNDSNMVTITKQEYDKLVEAAEFLDALICCGVDNWAGYEDAQEIMEEADNLRN